MDTARIGTYIDTYQLVQRLKQHRRIPVNTAKLRQELNEIAYRLDDNRPGSMEFYEWKGNRYEDAGLRPFTDICSLSLGFKELANTLVSAPRETKKDKDWRGARYEDMHSLIQRFNDRFAEVSNSLVFVYAGADEKSFRYYTDDGWKANEDEITFFEELPQISQSCFRDAAKCMALGLNRACLSLAVQAVEATIRYCLRRMIPTSQEKDWGPMLTRLSTENSDDGQTFISQNLKSDLVHLKDRYRNIISHGRAKYEVSDSRSVRDCFDQCWLRTQDLLTEMKPQSKYQLLLHIHRNFTFDAALASYLFKSNLEIPMVGFTNPSAYHRIDFDDSKVTENQLYDENADKYLPEKPEGCASREALGYHLRPQELYGPQIDYLVHFAARRKGGLKDSLNPHRKESFDLADLFWGIRIMGENSDPADVLDNVWKMFDEFIPKRSLRLENDAGLIKELGMNNVYEFICSNLQ